MPVDALFLHHAFATALANVTAVIPIPIQITPILGTPSAYPPMPGTMGVTAPTFGGAAAGGGSNLDAIILAALGPAAAGIFAYFKNKLSAKTSEKRAEAIVDTQQGTVNSLMASDESAKDDAKGVNALIMKLCENPDLKKLLTEPTDANHDIKGESVADYVKNQADGWSVSNNQYYDKVSPIPGDKSKDPIIQQAASIAQLTRPTIT